MIEKIKPPKEIDGAKILFWDWSGNLPFGFVSDIEIFGLAICKYENDTNIYRFSCNENWETEQDGLYDSVENAMTFLPEQYKNVEVIWQTYE
jgi:hypothetical protein